MWQVKNIILLFSISLVGCALNPVQQNRIDTNPSDIKAVQGLADIELGELLNYQQQQYQLEDPLGDHALLNLLLQTAPEIAWLTLTGEGYSQIIADINEWRSEFEYKPIGLDRFQGMRESSPGARKTGTRKTWSKDDDVFLDVIVQEQKSGIVPRSGVCHRWSSIYRKYPQANTFPYMAFSKLFWALAYGDSSVYFVTENEEQLAQWIVDQKHRSVTLKQVFRKSYQINSGDVYLSILTATNVFSRFWYVGDRESLSIATRLKLITTGQDGTGDNFGAWHHFWGMVLFGYCHGETSSSLVGWIESFGSNMVTKYDEADEDYINRHAGQIGAELRYLIDHWPQK